MKFLICWHYVLIIVVLKLAAGVVFVSAKTSYDSKIAIPGCSFSRVFFSSFRLLLLFLGGALLMQMRIHKFYG